MSRIFRLFISSTFSDFMLERERLQKDVFPELEKYCASKGAKFLAVDLRWGITEAAQVEHDTLRICLDEIRRSQKLSPRPNFAVLLGNRYGWEPIPARIPLDHWTRLLEYANAKDQKIIRSAYYPRPDTNAIPPNYILKSREVNWLDGEVFELSVRDALRRCAASFDKADRLPYFASATHQEIVMGAMETPNAKEHVHVYVRTIKDLPFMEEAKAFIDWDAKTGSLVQGASDRLKGLELELRARLPGMVRDYGTTWIGASSPNLISDGYLDAFCKQFFEDQKVLIDQEMERLDKAEPCELRERLHEDFARARSENFVGREAILKVIYSYIASIASQSNKKFTPLILHGEGGTGKSAIMAHAYQTTKTRNPNAVVLVRFIGGVPGCEEIGSILRDLIEDICRYYQSPVPQEMNSVKELNQAFESVMQLSSEDKPLIIFLDALDQLGNGDGAWLLEWLPKSLSPYTRFILTTREGATLNSVQQRIPKSLKLVAPMSNADGAKMLKAWLSSYKEARFSAGIAPTEGRKLSTTQRHSVIEQFKGYPKPLWLKLVYEEVRTWRSWDEPRIFPNEIKGMVSELINKRLLKDDKHLPIFTHRALAYIAAGRFGLAEDELAKVLASDEAVIAEFQAAEKTDKKWSLDRIELPPILWSRLYFDLAPYLSSAQIDGAELFRYFHREFKEVVEEQLLKDRLGEEIHAQLAIMFSKMGDQNTNTLFRQTNAGRQQQSMALRRIMEEPWQLTRGGQQEQLSNILTNFGFCLAKCAANQSEDLLNDYRDSGFLDSSGSNVDKWASFFQANAHFLRRGDRDWPAHKIFQQRSIEAANESTITTSSKAWLNEALCDWTVIKNVDVLQNNNKNTFIATLEGHSKNVDGAISLGNKRALSWSEDRGLRIWDLQTRICESVLEGHKGKIKGVIQLSDGNFLSWAADPVLRIWNVKTFSCNAELKGHTNNISGAILLDGMRILSWAADNTLRVWDAKTGECLALLEGHTKKIIKAIPLGNWGILSWAQDGALMVWDIETGECQALLSDPMEIVAGVVLLDDFRVLYWSTNPLMSHASSGPHNVLKIWDIKSGAPPMELLGHTGGVVNAMPLDDGRILSWSWDGTLRVWDSKAGACKVVLKGHNGRVSDALILSGKRILSWSSDATLRIWDSKTGICQAVLEGHTKPGIKVITLDDRRILSWSGDQTLRIWDSESGVCLALLKGHLHFINGAFPFDERRILSWSDDQTLRVWDANTGECEAVLRGHTGSINGALILGDGRILSWSVDATLRVWDVQTERIAETQEDEMNNIYSISNLGSSYILSVSLEGVLSLWDTQNGTCKSTMSGHTKDVGGAILLDDRRLLSWSWDRTLRIWDLATGACERVLEGHTKVVNGAITLDDRQILSWSLDGSLRIWDLKAGVCQGVLGEHGNSKGINGVKLITNNKVLSWGGDGTLRIWDIKSGICSLALDGHEANINGVLLLDHDRVLSWSDDATLRMWDLKSGTCKAVFEGHVKSVRGGVKNVILLKDGRILSWGPEKRVIMVWDGDTGKSLGVLSSGISRVSNSFDPRISSLIGATLLKDGRILSWSADFTLYIWDGKSYGLVKIIHSDSLEKFGTLEIFDSLLNEDYPVMRRGDWFINANTTRISAINRRANEISRWEADGRPSLLKTQNGLICSKVGHRLTFLKLGQI